MRRILRSSAVQTPESKIEVLAFKEGRRHFVAIVIDGNEVVNEVPNREAALLTFRLQVRAAKRLAKEAWLRT